MTGAFPRRFYKVEKKESYPRQWRAVAWDSFLSLILISRSEELHPAVRLFSSAAGDQVIACRHLMLQPTNVGVSGSQFSRRQAFVQNLMNSILCLQQGARG